MHRAFDTSETPFQSRSSTGVYLFTALVGGLLLADACCGAPQFDKSFRAMIEKMQS